jgi:hypothetical protein
MASEPRANVQHGVFRKCGWTEEQWAILQISAVVRAGQATFNFKSYLQQNNFNGHRFPADGILIPHLQKALYVSGNAKTLHNFKSII